MLAATALLAAFLLGWTVVTPAYRAPDEAQHLSTALRLATGGGYPPFGTARMDPAVLASYHWVDYTGPGVRVPTRPADLMAPPSMAALRAPGLSRPAAGIDQMTQHPPGYYALLAAEIRLLGLNGASPQGMVFVLRLLSACLLLPIPWLCVLAGRRLGLSVSERVAAAFLPAGWIQFTHVGAGINNGALLVLAASVAAVSLLAVSGGDVRKRMSLTVGGTVCVALLTKGFGLALLATAALAYLRAARTAGRVAAGRAAGLALAATTLGLAWWVGNVVKYGQPQPSRPPGTPWIRGVGDLGLWAKVFWDFVAWTMWGALGAQEGRPPRVAYVGATALLCVLLTLGSWRLRRAPFEVALLHSLWMLPLLIMVYGSIREYLITGSIHGAQGRYLQPAVVAFAVLVVLARPGRPRFLGLVPLGAGLVGTAGLAFGSWLFRTGDTTGAGWWDATVGWWPGGAVALPAAVLLAIVGTGVGVWTLWAGETSPPRSGGGYRLPATASEAG